MAKIKRDPSVYLFDQEEASLFGPPRRPGVYAVCMKDKPKSEEQILYIGSSYNVFKRVMNPNHPYRVCFAEMEGKFIYTKTILTDDYVELEKRLIKIYQPQMNKQYK